jgi:hypothetical protein
LKSTIVYFAKDSYVSENNQGATMKRFLLVLALLAAGAAHAQLVQIEGGWVNPMTGEFYPSAGDNTAVDQNTGRTLVVPDAGQRRRAQPQQAVPAGANCQWVRASVHDRHTLLCQ